jgi:hypothetical protein
VSYARAIGGRYPASFLLIIMTAAPAIVPAQNGVDFRAAAAYRVAAEPNAMALHDLDGDGHLDVAAAAFRASAVSILLGDGSGALRRVDDAVAMGSSLGIAAGLFDADALPDLIVTQRESDNMWLFRNLGGGSFASPRLVLGGHDPWPVVAVDFDGDGFLDAVQGLAPEVGGRVNILYGTGAGTFGEPVGARTGGANSALAVADFDRDGRLDAVVANLTRASVSVLLGREDGTLAPHLESPVGNEPAGIATGDLDADGILDLVVTSTIGDAVTVSAGVGDGRFAPAESHAVGDGPVGVALTDLDLDGHLDIVAGNSGSAGGTVSILLGDGMGDFAAARTFIAETAPFAVAAGDLNEDGIADVVTVNGGDFVASVPQSTATVLLGNGATLDAVEQLASPVESTAIAVADIDADALPDVVAMLPGTEQLTAYRRGARGFEATAIALPGEPTALTLSDLDGDDLVDIIAAIDGSGELVVRMNRGGFFAEAIRVAAGGEPLAINAGDYDGDGRIDIVAALAATSEVTLLRGNGAGGFSAPVRTGLSARPVAMASGELGAGEGADVAVALASGVLAILGGRAAGPLEAAPEVPVVANPVALAVLDVDGDELDELAVVHAAGVTQVLIAEGDGGFVLAGSFGGVETPTSIAARDVTGDGFADLLISQRLRDAVAVLSADGAGGFAPPVHLRVGDLPRGLAIGDFDDDGGYDFATACIRPAVASNRRGGALRGDGNGDGVLAAADLVAIAAAVRVARCILVERYAFPAVDADGDGVVCRQDARAAVRRIFRGGGGEASDG